MLKRCEFLHREWSGIRGGVPGESWITAVFQYSKTVARPSLCCDYRLGEKCHCDETRSTPLAEARRYNTDVHGSADDHEPTDIAAMLSDSDLSAENRRYVHQCTSHQQHARRLEGPPASRLALLIDAVAGKITAAEYARCRVHRNNAEYTNNASCVPDSGVTRFA